jgi:hypothetical protein
VASLPFVTIDPEMRRDDHTHATANWTWIMVGVFATGVMLAVWTILPG